MSGVASMGFHSPPPVDDVERRVNRQAACKGLSERFLVPHPSPSQAEWLRRVCFGCPVMKECRATGDRVEMALFGREAVNKQGRVTGFLGGETVGERRARRLALVKQEARQGDVRTCSHCSKQLPVEFFYYEPCRQRYRPECITCKRLANTFNKSAGRVRFTLAMTGEKACERCTQTLPVTAFSVHGQTKDGRRKDCIDCQTLTTIERVAESVAA